MGEITIEELKQKKIWFVWNYMPGKNGKITKIPFSAYGGATGTDDKYRDTWAVYDEAYAAMQKCGASGIGFKVPEEVYFLDIDHRELSDPLSQKFLKRHNSYTEFSPSGNGIHILGTCDAERLPIIYDAKKQRNILSSEFYQKNSALGVELYIGSATNRFATFTGNVVNDTPLAEGEGTEKHMLFYFYFKRYKKSTSLRLSSGGFSKFCMIFGSVYMLNLIIFLPSALQFFLDLLQI